MKNLDNLYEAYQNYKKLCVVDNDTPRFLSAYMRAKDRDSEDIITVFSVCHIEQDWVEAIEVGIPFIEKAIREERQFIRNDGEVLPIEKIRKTSKSSIQDLAKHANYITHEAPEGSATEVLPDKMLMIQKESDFAIYENRVLYAALMYLKDFVTSRLVEIKETTNTYIVKQHIKKRIDMGARKIDIDLSFDERHVNDPLLTDKNQEKDVIDRLDEILTNILALLKTPLMREVSKVEMVSRPISKTNILKMNRNFRESLACFDYIANYQGQGFTIEHVEKSLIPYSKQMNESYSEILIMLSFINYMYANNIQNELRDDYEEILRNRELQKENDVLARLRDFHATANEKEQTINEFLILFEQGYRILETRNDEMNILVKENEARRQKEIKDLEDKHRSDIEELEQEHNQHLKEMENAKQDEMMRQLEEFKDQYKDQVEQMKQENAEIKSHYQEQNEKISRLESEILHYRLAEGDTSAIDYTGEEDFDRLEKLKKEFDTFYEKAWKAAKKQIRKDVLFAKRKKNKKNEDDLDKDPSTKYGSKFGTIEEKPIDPIVMQVRNKQTQQAEQPVVEQPAEEKVNLTKEPEVNNEEPLVNEPVNENKINLAKEPVDEPSEEQNEVPEELEAPIEEEVAPEQEPNEEPLVEEEPTNEESAPEAVNEEMPVEEPADEESSLEDGFDAENEPIESNEEVPNEQPVEEEPNLEQEPNEEPIEEEPALEESQDYNDEPIEQTMDEENNQVDDEMNSEEEVQPEEQPKEEFSE